VEIIYDVLQQRNVALISKKSFPIDLTSGVRKLLKALAVVVQVALSDVGQKPSPRFGFIGIASIIATQAKLKEV
jgi:hypothetical protein